MSAGKLRSLGEVAMSERRFDDAVSLYKEAIEMEPKNAANYYKLYRVHSRMRHWEDALTDLTNALTVDPNLDDYRLTKAKLMTNLGLCQEAVEEYVVLKQHGFRNEEVSNGEEEAAECASKVAIAQQAYADSK